MNKLLTTAGLMAAALICQTPEGLMHSIPKFGPIITRPDSPKDAQDMAKIKDQHKCIFIKELPLEALRALRNGEQHSAAPKEHEEL